jgi:hypothetical protein
MSGVELHNVDDAVEQIANDLRTHHGPATTWSVLGEPTAGKSAVLEMLYDRLSQDETLTPVLVTAPPRSYDSGHAALIELAEGLELRSSALQQVQDPQVPWAQKLHAVRIGLGREGRKVLLLDEPAAWSPRESYFRTFVGDVWELLFDRFDTATVTAGRTPFRVARHRGIHLEPASDADHVLATMDAPSLAEAKRVVESRFGDQLANVSPLQVRLLVAIAALDQDTTRRIDAGSVEHRSKLVAHLAALVGTDHPDLRDVWLRLALVREPFESDLLGLVGQRRLSELEGAILDSCLLFPRRSRLLLHESLRTVTTMVEHDRQPNHQLVAGYYRHRFDDPESGVAARMRDSIEAFHHASSAGIVDLNAYRPFFVDQLNILGYHLSVAQEDLRRAAEVFQLALSWDPRNPYAAHYRAFNLDRMAGTTVDIDPNEVERLYRLAAEEWPDHVWFRSRLITFLIAEARIEEAWSEFLSAIDAIGPDPTDFAYFGLHLHVARSFLYRGELDYAEHVVRGLPAELEGDERFVAIKERLGALREARDHGSYVPAPYLKSGWWRAPKLLSPHDLTRWVAARVTSVLPDVVELDVADITPGSSPAYGSLELPKETLRSWWRGPGDLSELLVGDFLELGFYGHGDDVEGRAVRHPQLRWLDLARPHEDPDRYLRAAA